MSLPDKQADERRESRINRQEERGHEKNFVEDAKLLAVETEETRKHWKRREVARFAEIAILSCKRNFHLNREPPSLSRMHKITNERS